MNALEIKNLSKEYPHFRLDRLSLTLPGGCIMGLVGENGAGKSTTIKLLLNMIHRDGGTITILGRDNRNDLSLLKEEIGVVLDDVGLPECLKAGQIGKVMKGIFKSWDDVEYEKYLRRLSIPTDRKFKEFSRGMKMKLGIAVALSHHPKLLLLDVIYSRKTSFAQRIHSKKMIGKGTVNTGNCLLCLSGGEDQMKG